MSLKESCGVLILIGTLCCLGAGASQPRRTQYPRNALPGLTPSQVQAFLEGQDAFHDEETAADGLGPIFNGRSCGECHPDGGGSSRISNIVGSGRHQFAAGGPVIQISALPGFAPETVPDAMTVGKRRAMTTRGLGLVGAISDDALLNEQVQQQVHSPETAGKANMVTDAVTGLTRVGRIGQKSQHPNSTSFAAEAYLREMGITTPFFPHEEAPYNNPNQLAGNPRPDVNDDGDDVFAFGMFMDLVKPPAKGTVARQDRKNVNAGSHLFEAIGCANCHKPTWVTASSSIDALDDQAFSPYSDFLLHDMGDSGDQVPQGTDSLGQPIPGSWMRTTPLWGLHLNPALWHDGSIKQGDYTAAINNHSGQGSASRAMFHALSPKQKQQLLLFLRSL